MNQEVSEIKGFLRGIFWGILLTIGAVIFLETERGQKLKKKLRKKGEDILEELPDLLDRLEEKSEELVEEAGRIEEEIKEKTEGASQGLAEEIGEKLDTSLGHIEAIQEHGREISQGIKKHLFKNIPKRSRAN